MILAVIVSVIAAALLVLIFRKQVLRGATSLKVFAIALLVWAAAYGLLAQNTWDAGLLWLGIIYLASSVTVSALLVYVLIYTNRARWISRWTYLLLGVEPLLTQLFIWVQHWREVFFEVRANMAPTSGPWFWINQSYLAALALLGLIFLIQAIQNKSRQYINQTLLIALGTAMPFIVKLLEMTGLAPFAFMDLSPLAYGLTGICLGVALLLFDLLDIHLISREEVVERMSDGLMIIDMDNRIIDLNPAAEMVLGAKRSKLFATPANETMVNWPNLTAEQSARELEGRASMMLNKEWHVLNTRFLPLFDADKKQVGRIVLWRDFTERKKSNDARQKARDEMFVLLHSISGAASQTLNLDDFLSEASRQVVYAFQSQVSLIFLAESGLSETRGTKFRLAAHHGVPGDNLPHLSNSRDVAAIIELVLATKQTFYIPDVSTDSRLPEGMQRSGNRTLLLMPMVTRGQAVGAIGLLRREGTPYTPEELNRLGVVADELASLIYSDRQRQLAAVLEERQRTVRDLHDSVTQKLYALVQLSEAAQAALENGTPEQSAQVARRIGEYARQALKEMRLFLFEKKPVDLEHEGLVSVLHQRLAAVEGRADMVTRLVADEEIDLPLEKQVALYYIAQEALNNILKHANAHSVEILLKRGTDCYTLQISDDGKGFDFEQTDKGGIGLASMRERVAKAGGQLDIQSVPGEGTKIIATVSSENGGPAAQGMSEDDDE